MKRFLMIIAVLFIAVNSNAQQVKTNIKLDSQSIVKDAEGGVYPYAIWTKLLQTNQYSIKANGNEFLMYRLSAEEAAKLAAFKSTNMVNMPKPLTSDSFIEGEKFRADKITAINGNKFDLKNNTDKIYVINFWFINCAPCKKEIPDLNEIVKKYKDNPNVVFLAIALDEGYQLKDFLKTTPFNYNIVADGRYYAQKYGVKSYPTHVIVGKDGLIKFSARGLTSNTAYWIEKILKEQTAVL
jgi:thiol-disulfide isomerase/thioredoxin